MLTLALPPDGKGGRTFQCFDCDRPDPLKTEKAMRWLKSQLQAADVDLWITVLSSFKNRRTER